MSLALMASIVALVIGIIILLVPRALNYLVAFYLIVVGAIGIINELN